MSRAKALKDILESTELEFLMEAHDGLSAKLAQRARFKALWASGLSIASALGLRDANEASWSQILNQVEFIVDSSDLPVLIDGDTGHGNFNNARRFARKLHERGVGGVCLEDKRFPKANSFLEALIAGRSMEEALERGHAYVDSGAHAILIHSKKSTAAEVVEFAGHWQRSAPLVIVPTKYADTPVSVFEQHGISAVIWANHSIRAAAAAIRLTCESIQAQRSTYHLKDHIASLDDLFELMNYDELTQAEGLYSGSRSTAESAAK